MADYGYNGYSQGTANQGTVKKMDNDSEDKKKYKFRKMLKRHASERKQIKESKSTEVKE